MHFCVVMCALLIVSPSLLSRKKNPLCCHHHTRLGNSSEMPALGGEVKRSSSELKSDPPPNCVGEVAIAFP